MKPHILSDTEFAALAARLRADLANLTGAALEARAREATLRATLIQAIEAAGFPVSGPTDSRAAENGEPVWVCNARAALAGG